MSAAYSPIPELNLLKEFEDGLKGEFFSPGFEFMEYDADRDWFCGAAPDAYLARLIPFAYATGSGSWYALWRCDDREDLATLPVVFFGDEGDLAIEACDLRELFQYLGAEPEDPEEREDCAEGREQYLDWLDRNFGLGPLGMSEDGDGDGDGGKGLIGEYERRFALWVAEFADEELRAQVAELLGVELPASV